MSRSRSSSLSVSGKRSFATMADVPVQATGASASGAATAANTVAAASFAAMPVASATPTSATMLPPLPTGPVGGTGLSPLAPHVPSSSVPLAPGTPALPSFLAPIVNKPRMVPIGGGEGSSIGAGGTFSGPKPLDKPPTHKQNQAAATSLGHATASAFMALPPLEQTAELRRLETLSQQTQQLAMDARHVSAKHESRARLWTQKPTGKAFRALHAGQDEATQSQTTAHLVAGMRSAVGPKPAAQVEQFVQSAGVLMSTLRMPTAQVSAPIAIGGKVRGQQHPTDKSVPKIVDGGSAHSQADRDRSSSFVTTGAAALASHGPFAALAGGAVAAVSSTLGSMSLPHTASNVQGGIFSPAQVRQQQAGRETLKSQGRLMLTALGAAADTRTQSATAPVGPLEAPLSPRRVTATPVAAVSASTAKTPSSPGTPH